MGRFGTETASWRGHQLLLVRLGYAEMAAGSSLVGWSTDPSHTQLKSHRTMSELWFQAGINYLHQSPLIGSLSKRASLPAVVSEGQTQEVGTLRQEEVYGGAPQSTVTELGGLLSRRPWPLLRRWVAFFCPWWLSGGSQALNSHLCCHQRIGGIL